MGQGMYGGMEGSPTPVTAPVQTPVQAPTPTPGHIGRGAPPVQFRGRAMAQGLRGRGFIGRGRGRYDGRTLISPRSGSGCISDGCSRLQHHKDLPGPHRRCPLAFPLDLGIKIGTKTEMGMRLRLRVWTMVATRTVVRERRRGNQKTVDIPGKPFPFDTCLGGVLTVDKEASHVTRLGR